ncbi:MAG: PAS domain-containing hybrid sensor histidine kinase/response regulator [Ignavibacteriaceae bacterium]
MDTILNDNLRLENSLNDNGKIFSQVYDETSDIMFLLSVNTDESFTYLSVNNAFTKIVGLPKSKCTGKNFGQVFPNSFTLEMIEILKMVSIKKLKYETEISLDLKAKFYFQATVIPILNNADECLSFLIVARDITEQKKHEVELLATKIKAEESNRLKASLLANMSHELRTPLNGILGFADILNEELKNPEYKEMASFISKSSKRLLITLHSILELSVLEAERQEVYNTTLIINEIINEVSERYLSDAKMKNLSLTINIPGEQIKLHLDESLFKQILNNLLDNAIKFTKIGGITITASETIEEGKSYVDIKIIDTGIGISKENLESIFKEFRQESEGFGRSHEGTGLGLTLAKKMTELMGGKIIVESKKNSGSVFSLRFPAMNTNSGNIKTFPDLQNTGKRASRKLQRLPNVLLVEDNDMNSKLTRVFLKNLYNVDAVADAASALHLINEKNYDIILMDINLGEGLNGVDVVEQIRKIGIYENVPIIALTGYALNLDRENFLSCGFTHYLAKPFDKNQLIDMLNNAVTVSI